MMNRSIIERKRAIVPWMLAVAGVWGAATATLGAPNLVANGDLERPQQFAEGRYSKSENEAIFSFPGELNFGRVVASGTGLGPQLAEQLRVGYAQLGSGLRGLAIDAKEVKVRGDYDITIWFDLKGRIRPNREYAYSLSIAPLENNAPEIDVIVPAVWADGDWTGTKLHFAFDKDEGGWTGVERRGVVKTPNFKYQTGGQAFVLQLPKGFNGQFFVVRASLREIDEDLLAGRPLDMPTPTRYIPVDDVLEERISVAIRDSVQATDALLQQMASAGDAGFAAIGQDVNQSVTLVAGIVEELGYAGKELDAREMEQAAEWLAEQEEGVDTIDALTGRLSCLAAHYPERHRQTIAADMLAISKAQFSDGGWSNAADPRAEVEDRRLHSDNGHTLAACMALRDAHYVGLKANRRLWFKAADYWRKAQARDGGFRAMLDDYGGLGEATTSYNTAVGLTGLYVTLDMAYAADSTRCDQYLANERHLDGITQALGWLEAYYDEYFKQFGTLGSQVDPYANAFYMQVLADASGVRVFNDKNVFRREAEILLERAPAGGLFDNSQLATMYALASLNRGGAPVVFQRAVLGGAFQHRLSRDAEHLVRYLRKQRRALLNWRVVETDQPVRDLLEVPILYLNVAGTFEEDAGFWQRLREYCFGGGVVVLNLNEDVEGQRALIEAGLKRAFPEYELKALGKDDLVLKKPHDLSKLEGIRVVGNGLKNFVFLTPEDWSCHLNNHLVEDHPEAFEFFDNLYEYTLDGEKPRSSFAGSTRVREAVASMAVPAARMEVGASLPAYPELLAELDRCMRSEYRLEVQDKSAEPMADPVLLWLSCAGDQPLTDSQRRQINEHIDRGAFLFAEVLTGDTAWAESFRADLLKLGDGFRMRRLLGNHPLVNGQLNETYGFDVRLVGVRRALREAYEKLPRAELYIIERNDQEVGVLSVYDIGSGLGHVLYPECRGLMPEDSRKLAANVVLYAMQRQHEAEQ